MTPKEKAEELKDKLREHTKSWDCYNDCPLEEDHAKEASIVFVDEILKELGELHHITPLSFWYDVKEELNKA